MQISGIDAINLLVGSGGLLGVVLIIFRFGKLVQKIENLNEKIDNVNGSLNEKIENLNNNMNERFSVVEKKFDKVDERLSALEKGQTELRVQLGKLETRVEERTFRVIQTTREIKPDPAHFGSLNIQEEKIVKNTSAAV